MDNETFSFTLFIISLSIGGLWFLLELIGTLFDIEPLRKNILNKVINEFNRRNLSMDLANSSTFFSFLGNFLLIFFFSLMRGIVIGFGAALACLILSLIYTVFKDFPSQTITIIICSAVLFALVYSLYLYFKFKK